VLQPSDLFVAFSGPAPIRPCLSCAEGSRVVCRTAGGVSSEQSRGAESPPLTSWPRFFWCSWPFGLWAHIAGWCQDSHQSALTSPSWQGCSQSIVCLACICAWDCLNPCAGPCTWPCWTSWGSHRPTSPACPGLSGFHPFCPASGPHTFCPASGPAWCRQHTCWGCTQSHHPCCEQRCYTAPVPKSTWFMAWNVLQLLHNNNWQNDILIFLVLPFAIFQ